MTVKYMPVVHDGPYTMEQQIWLLAKAADRVWRAWGPDTQGINAELDEAMRDVFRQLCQTDVFMGGFHQGKIK